MLKLLTVAGLVVSVVTSAHAASKAEKHNELVKAVIIQCKKLDKVAKADCLDRADRLDHPEFTAPMKPEWKRNEWRSTMSKFRKFRRQYPEVVEAARDSLKK